MAKGDNQRNWADRREIEKKKKGYRVRESKKRRKKQKKKKKKKNISMRNPPCIDYAIVQLLATRVKMIWMEI